MNLLKRFWRSAPKEIEAVAHPVRAEVLIVEDDVEQLELLAGLLRLQGAIVTRAGNIAGALEVLSGPSRFQLAFVDLSLPDGSGTEVVRLIKERRRGTHVVVCSGDYEKIIAATAYGHISVLAKPYHIGAIREVLQALRLPYND